MTLEAIYLTKAVMAQREAEAARWRRASLVEQQPGWRPLKRRRRWRVGLHLRAVHRAV